MVRGSGSKVPSAELLNFERRSANEEPEPNLNTNREAENVRSVNDHRLNYTIA